MRLHRTYLLNGCMEISRQANKKYARIRLLLQKGSLYVLVSSVKKYSYR